MSETEIKKGCQFLDCSLGRQTSCRPLIRAPIFELDLRRGEHRNLLQLGLGLVHLVEQQQRPGKEVSVRTHLIEDESSENFQKRRENAEKLCLV